MFFDVFTRAYMEPRLHIAESRVRYFSEREVFSGYTKVLGWHV